MENASKALLIAAAVLIVILLVAFGVGIFKSAEDATDVKGSSTAMQEGMKNATSILQHTIPGAKVPSES